MHSTAEIVTISIFLLFFTVGAIAIEVLLTEPVRVLSDHLLPGITTPLRWLYRLTLGHIPGLALTVTYTEEEDARGRRRRKRSEPAPWTDFQSRVFFYLALICVAVFYVILWIVTKSPEEAAIPLVFGTTLGSIFGLLSDGFTPNFADILCTGFGSLLSFVILQKARPRGFFKYVLYNLVFLMFGSMLGQLLADAFAFVATWSVEFFNALIHDPAFQNASSLQTALRAIGLGILVLILGYLGVVLLLTAITELLANVRFGAVPLVLFIVLVWFASFIPHKLLADVVTYILLFGMMLVTELLRLYPQYDPIERYVSPWIKNRLADRF